MVKKTSKSKSKVKKEKETTIVSILIDASGSMVEIAGATMEGCNSYIKTLKNELKDQNVYFSMLQFSGGSSYNFSPLVPNLYGGFNHQHRQPNNINKIQVGVPINEAVNLTSENYRPDGGTPLIDAAVKTILATDELYAKYGGKVIVVIQTDGFENMSTEYNSNQLRLMVEDRTSRGWSFVFLGAGINAFTNATQYGFSKSQTISYGLGKSNEVFRGLASNSVMYASGAAASMSFNETQRNLVGEKDLVDTLKTGKI